MAETLVFTRADVARLLPLADCIAAVEAAFGALGRGEVEPPGTLAVHSHDGGFHIKAGTLPRGDRRYFAAKTNGNFPRNTVERGLPTIQGLVMLCDADDGRVLAVMDSIEITALRTAAATAVAARYLARPDAEVAAICGCGVQGRVQLRALREVLPLRRVHAYDADATKAQQYADEMSAASGLEVIVELDVARAIAAADVTVTCTTAQQFFVFPEAVPRGAFVAGVGVDSEHKRELAPGLLASADKVVTDLRAQCARIGDLHHALDAGVLSQSGVHADLGDVVAGKRPGREHVDEVIVFDSTGIAIQDVAAAAAIYERVLGSTAADAGELRRIEFT